MVYSKQIIDTLLAVGEKGIGVQQLAMHIYNLNCTLFSQPDLRKIHNYVQQYLLRNSKSPQSLIEHTGRRGFYRLNTNNDDARQLVLEFRKHKTTEDDTPEETPQRDLSLSLF